MPTIYKLHKPDNYIGRIIAIGKEDRLSWPDLKKHFLGAIGEVQKGRYAGNGMISCFFYPLRQAKANKDRDIFTLKFWYCLKVRIQRIKEKL